MNDEVWSMEPGRGNSILQLGAPRDEVLRRLAAAGIEVDEEDDEEDDESESLWSYVEEMDAELTFAGGPGQVLEEIAISDDRMQLGPIDLIDEPLCKVIELLRVVDEETVWTRWKDDVPPSDSNNDPPTGETAISAGESAVPPPADNKSPSARQLLSDGTLWIRPFGLGLVLVYGDVITVRLRRPGDVPSGGYGSLTAEQRELAAQDDLTSILLGRPPLRREARPRSSRFQQLAGLALVIGIGLVIWRAIDFQRRWNESPIAEGVVVAVNPPPPEPFPDEYTIAYHDESGTLHEVVFGRADMYGLPPVGGKIELRYLPEAPDEPLGPARVRDIAIETFIPWGVGVFVAYFVLQLAVAIVGWAWRRAETKNVRMA
ncbi:MAG: hypothetical protein WD875_00480 [Pirellulales bacterium]